MNIKNILAFCLLFCRSLMFSQDNSKTLQANKWYVKYDTNTMKLIYSKKPLKDSEESMIFKENGTIVWCGNVEESSFDAAGIETMATHFKCDSIRKYEVKNGKLKTQLLKQTPEYFKLVIKGDKVELTPIKAEDYK